MDHPAPVFPDKSQQPTLDDFVAVIGRAAKAWARIGERLEAAHGPLRFEWKHYGKASGWTLKVFKGTRNLCFVGPRVDAFVVSFVMGNAAVAAVERTSLPAPLVAELVGARKYAEGRGVRVEVRTLTDADHVIALAGIKAAH